MKKTILLTRPRAASERWAALLMRRGFDCGIEPLLTIESTHAPRPLGNFQAVLVTSVHAPDALKESGKDISDILPLPCFCVGTASGAAAQAAGFTDVCCGAADSAALARKVVAALSNKTKPLLHIASEAAGGKIRRILAENGLTLTLWAVYRAFAVEDFTPETKVRFARGDFAALPVFSSRSARTLVSIIEKNHLTCACPAIIAVGLSQAVADVLQILPWRQLRVASRPEEEDVFACL